MSNNDYILFYSNKCLHSKELLGLLYKDVTLNEKFTKINIDNPNIKIPPYVKSVPSAIIQNNGKPFLLVGSEIFKWYNSMHKKVVDEVKIQEWDPQSMSGYSDGFSYIENADVMKKSFSFLNDTNNIITPDEKNYGDKGNKTEEKTELDVNYQKFMDSRKMDVAAPPRTL